ncbi:MAG: alpha/beta hydrolase [Planctomycetaceae bacterium]|nr:alpha/beta hydrolase [Planctomycetaceae bacterium]
MNVIIKPLVVAILTLGSLEGGGDLFAQDSSGAKRDREQRLAEVVKRFPESDANKDGRLTLEEFQAFQKKRRDLLERRESGRDRALPPSHKDVAYGEHEKQRFDLWLPADAGEPTPLVIFIHGGGFRGGDKSAVSRSQPQFFLDEGIAFASMNYRLSDVGPYPIMMHDAARGLQTIRHRAKEWNIDPKRIVCFGGSAGAGISLWLGFHDDLADPDSEDPIARESTRILAAGTMGGQSTYDQFTFREWFGVPDLPMHSALPAFYGIESEADLTKESVRAAMRDASPITHLSPDDQMSVYMTYNRANEVVTKETSQSVWVHHVLLGMKLQEAMGDLGLTCYVTAPGMESNDDPFGSMHAFLVAKAKGDQR